MPLKIFINSKNFYRITFVLKVESTLAMKSLQPQVKAVQQRYAGDQVFLLLGALVVIYLYQ